MDPNRYFWIEWDILDSWQIFLGLIKRILRIPKRYFGLKRDIAGLKKIFFWLFRRWWAGCCCLLQGLLLIFARPSIKVEHFCIFYVCVCFFVCVCVCKWECLRALKCLLSCTLRLHPWAILQNNNQCCSYFKWFQKRNHYQHQVKVKSSWWSGQSQLELWIILSSVLVPPIQSAKAAKERFCPSLIIIKALPWIVAKFSPWIVTKFAPWIIRIFFK